MNVSSKFSSRRISSRSSRNVREFEWLIEVSYAYNAHADKFEKVLQFGATWKTISRRKLSSTSSPPRHSPSMENVETIGKRVLSNCDSAPDRFICDLFSFTQNSRIKFSGYSLLFQLPNDVIVWAKRRPISRYLYGLLSLNASRNDNSLYTTPFVCEQIWKVFQWSRLRAHTYTTHSESRPHI